MIEGSGSLENARLLHYDLRVLYHGLKEEEVQEFGDLNVLSIRDRQVIFGEKSSSSQKLDPGLAKE